MIERVFTTQESKIKDLLTGEFDFGLKDPWALISIYHNYKEPVISGTENFITLRDKGCLKYLEVCFGDYTEDEYNRLVKKYKKASKKINIMNIDHAVSIVSFLNDLKEFDNIKTLIVQCKAGISRSGAVGLYACRFYGLDENEYLKSGHIKPNYYVYNTLAKVYNPTINLSS